MCEGNSPCSLLPRVSTGNQRGTCSVWNGKGLPCCCCRALQCWKRVNAALAPCHPALMALQPSPSEMQGAERSRSVCSDPRHMRHMHMLYMHTHVHICTYTHIHNLSGKELTHAFITETHIKTHMHALGTEAKGHIQSSSSPPPYTESTGTYTHTLPWHMHTCMTHMHYQTRSQTVKQ